MIISIAAAGCNGSEIASPQPPCLVAIDAKSHWFKTPEAAPR